MFTLHRSSDGGQVTKNEDASTVLGTVVPSPDPSSDVRLPFTAPTETPLAESTESRAQNSGGGVLARAASATSFPAAATVCYKARPSQSVIPNSIDPVGGESCFTRPDEEGQLKP